MRKNKIDEYRRLGDLQGRTTRFEVALNDGKTETLTFKNLILATGRDHPPDPRHAS